MQEKFMRRAIALAKKARGWCSPNPQVGAVIVKDEKIIAEGYHQKYGLFHAERNAINSLKDPKEAEGASLYVTLEPCCHTGKTPPCTQAIIEAGISKVIIGSYDPNPLVSGRGIKKLKEAGIQVQEAFLKDECDSLNSIFFHYITKKIPYVIMKYAMTADGKIFCQGKEKQISGPKSQKEVHLLRGRCRGIMVGINTVINDDPMLNCRLKGERSPVRIIVDSKLTIPLSSRIVQSSTDYETIIACALNFSDKKDLEKKEELEEHGIKVCSFPNEDGKVNLKELMQYLATKGIDGILLEGGAKLNTEMLKAKLVNEVRIFLAPKFYGSQGLSPLGKLEETFSIPSFKFSSLKQRGQDVEIRYNLTQEEK